MEKLVNMKPLMYVEYFGDQTGVPMEMKVEVNKLVELGYEPLGNVTVITDPDYQHMYIQAMFKTQDIKIERYVDIDLEEIGLLQP